MNLGFLKRFDALVLISAFCLFFIMFVGNGVIQDRAGYIQHFGNPFGDSRIEVGFHIYMGLYYMLGIDPLISIPLTSVIIYLVLTRAWLSSIKGMEIWGFLVFNIIMFGLMNYYMGTSIRMGLALSLAVFATIRISEKEIWLHWVILLASCFIHYGVIAFVLVVMFVRFFRFFSVRFHVLINVASFILACVIVEYFLGSFLTGYYAQYFNGQNGATDRFLPYSVMLSIFLWIFIARYAEEFYRRNLFLTLLLIYSIPLLLVSIVFNVSVLVKVLMPFFFIQSFLVVSFVFDKVGEDLMSRKYMVSVLLILLNVSTVLYALEMYNLLSISSCLKLLMV